MTTARTYDDSCGIARALDVVGERWALLVVRELVLGPKRFGQLRRGLPGMSPNVLSQRLRELEDAGVVSRQELEPPASVVVYDLTERGHELEPVLHALGRWGSAAPMTSGNELSADALLVALKTMFSPRAARDLNATYQLAVDGDPYTVRVADGGIDIRRGRTQDAVASLATDRATLARARVRRSFARCRDRPGRRDHQRAQARPRPHARPVPEMTPARAGVLARIASVVPPTGRIGIDGVDGAGKTTFADDLAAELRSRGRDVVRVRLDDFLNPSAVRHRRGRRSPSGYWADSFDYERFRAALPADGLGVVDGVFLQRPELAEEFGYVVFLDVSVRRSRCGGWRTATGRRRIRTTRTCCDIRSRSVDISPNTRRASAPTSSSTTTTSTIRS